MKLAPADENGIIKMGVEDIIRQSYLEYGKSTIVDRAFTSIDGFKPVNRRIMYDMMELKATPGKNKKCARIVGDTMGKYHPHGDSSIYGALVNITDLHESLNAPLIKGQGSFGKSWSIEHFVPAAMRYTECSLSEIANNELFNGIKENAVDMIDNFSMEFKEPRLLPVSFPNIIVNNTNGIAVGVSSYIPTYTLKGACEAVKAVINNPNITNGELADVLGSPDFVTGGNIHISRNQQLKLVDTGACSGVYLVGSYSYSKTQITIYELPYNTNIERFISELRDLYKEGKLKGVKTIDNTSGRDKGVKKNNNSKCTLKVEISLTKGTNPDEIMKIIRQNTSFCSPISFHTRFVWWNDQKQDFDYKECGIFDLLNKYWIPWRISTIRRTYVFRADALKKQRHLLEAWNKLINDLDAVIQYGRTHKVVEWKAYLQQTYGLDVEQSNYVVSKRLSSITQDEIEASIAEIAKMDEDIDKLEKVINSDAEIEKIICADMDRIIKKYAVDRKSNSYDLSLIEADKDEKAAPAVIENMPVWIGVNKFGGVKRCLTENEASKLEEWSGEIPMIKTMKCMNKDTLLVFTSTGFCYKIPVYSVENSRSSFKDNVFKLIDKDPEDNGEIIYVDTTSNFDGIFHIVYIAGVVAFVPYISVKGPRSKYRSLFPSFKPGVTAMVYKPNKFFIITRDHSAAHVDITGMNKFCKENGKNTLKLPRTKRGDAIIALMADEDIRLLNAIDIERFNKDYCVKMKDDENFILNKVEPSVVPTTTENKTDDNNISENNESNESNEGNGNRIGLDDPWFQLMDDDEISNIDENDIIIEE